MKMICPWAKLIVMLRNPTERAYSQYQMCVDPTGTPEQLKVRGEREYFMCVVCACPLNVTRDEKFHPVVVCWVVCLRILYVFKQALT
jgi:hypothetical protein